MERPKLEFDLLEVWRISDPAGGQIEVALVGVNADDLPLRPDHVRDPGEVRAAPAAKIEDAIARQQLDLGQQREIDLCHCPEVAVHPEVAGEVERRVTTQYRAVGAFVVHRTSSDDE